MDLFTESGLYFRKIKKNFVNEISAYEPTSEDMQLLKGTLQYEEPEDGHGDGNDYVPNNSEEEKEREDE